MSRQNVLNSPHISESKKRRRKVFLRKTLFIFFTILLIFVGLGFLSRIEGMNVSDISVAGNKVADTEVIKELAQEEMSGHYLWLYPKTNFLFYPKGGIENRLREEFKIIKGISISIENTSTLQITLSERTPVYTWCGNEFPDELANPEANKCYFMDDGGYVFSPAPYFSGDVYFRFFGHLTGDEGEIAGASFLPDIFYKIPTFLDSLRKMELKPTSLLAKDAGDIEIYLSSNSIPPNSPKIIVAPDFDIEQTAENLQTAMTTEPLQADLKKKYSSLIYIDLSFGNKVYFKFSAKGGSASGGN